MNNINIILRADSIKPTRAHDADAGYDLYSPVDFTVKSGEHSERINLGVKFEIPFGYKGETKERSSQGKRGIITAGNLVDSGYTGDVHVTLINLGKEDYEVKKGDRICQIVFGPVFMTELTVVTEFAETDRGEGAHGSTGI